MKGHNYFIKIFLIIVLSSLTNDCNGLPAQTAYIKYIQIPNREPFIKKYLAYKIRLDRSF